MATKISSTPSRRSTGSGRSQPRHLENHLAAADENDPAMGDDHACRQIDVIADEEHLTFPDDAVGLQRPPDGATRPADWRHIARRSVLLFIAVRHACFPRCSRGRPGDLGRKILCEGGSARYWRGTGAGGHVCDRTPCTYSLP